MESKLSSGVNLETQGSLHLPLGDLGSSKSDTLTGQVDRVTYHSEDSGYSILRVRTDKQPGSFTVLGFIHSISPGETIEAVGEWVEHKDFGRQLKATSIRAIPPSTLEGIEKYLASGMVKGIGPHFAEKLIVAFGSEVFDVIENQPEKLKKVSGIGPKRIEQITAAWADQKAIRQIMVFLQSHGVSTSKATRIFKTYGNQAVERVTADPYQLARDIQGVGFKSADLIAEKLGIAKDSVLRVRAGITFVLMERAQYGDCAYPEAELLQDTAKLLELALETYTLLLQEALNFEISAGNLVREEILREEASDGKKLTPCIFAKAFHEAEEEIVSLLEHLAQGSLPWGLVDFETTLPWVEKKINLELAPLQREAVKAALSSKISIITGGPGTGKSTLTRAILAILQTMGVSLTLCSPTGRAAKRLFEITGIEAKTIHRTLGFDPKKMAFGTGFAHDQDDPLSVDLLLVDEASMIDVKLMQALLKALPPRAGLLLIGDVDQLPSVGPGRILGDLIDSKAFTVVKLTQVFRQAAASRIVQTAHEINTGQIPDLEHREGSDFYFVNSENPEATIPKIIDLVQNRIPGKFGLDPVKDIQVLCPMQKGTLGARNLNIELQKVLNSKPVAKIERFGYTFAVGDKVMVLQNDYEKDTFNGDIGLIDSIDSTEQECRISFDGRQIIFDFSEMDILQPAYTITIHKSQGSEYPAVVIPIAMQQFRMLKRNLVYTGITRGKRLVILIGQKKALSIAIQAGGVQSGDHRWTNLSLKLRTKLGEKS